MNSNKKDTIQITFKRYIHVARRDGLGGGKKKSNGCPAGLL
jgi:hypothetical protein